MLRGIVGAGGAGTRLAARAAFVAAVQGIDKAGRVRGKDGRTKVAGLFQVIDARLRQFVQQGFHSHKKKLLPCSKNTHYCSIVSHSTLLHRDAAQAAQEPAQAEALHHEGKEDDGVGREDEGVAVGNGEREGEDEGKGERAAQAAPEDEDAPGTFNAQVQRVVEDEQAQHHKQTAQQHGADGEQSRQQQGDACDLCQKTGGVDLRADQQEDEGVGDEGQYLPEGIHKFARAWPQTDAPPVAAQKQRGQDNRQDAGGVQRVGQQVDAIGGDDGDGSLNQRLIDQLHQATDEENAAQTDQSAAASFEQEVQQAIQPRLRAGVGRALQGKQHEREKGRVQHAGHAVIEEAFSLNDG